MIFFCRVFGTSMVEEYEIADPSERADDQDDDLGQSSICFDKLLKNESYWSHSRNLSEKWLDDVILGFFCF